MDKRHTTRSIQRPCSIKHPYVCSPMLVIGETYMDVLMDKRHYLYCRKIYIKNNNIKTSYIYMYTATMDYTGYKFIKFRYILEEEASAADKAKFFLDYLVDADDEFYATAGFEKMNKTNEPTNPHIHIHVATKGKTVGGIRRALQRHFKDVKEKRKGNALYSLCEEDDVKDINRFFRYAWKQGGRLKRGDFVEKLPPDFDPTLEMALAQEEQQRMWEFNCKKKEESLRPNTKDKLFEYLDDIHENTPFRNKRSVLLKIMEYYNQEEKSANQSTIMGYLQTAAWRYKLETFEETADRWLNCV